MKTFSELLTQGNALLTSLEVDNPTIEAIDSALTWLSEVAFTCEAAPSMAYDSGSDTYNLVGLYGSCKAALAYVGNVKYLKNMFLSVHAQVKSIVE